GSSAGKRATRPDSEHCTTVKKSIYVRAATLMTLSGSRSAVPVGTVLKDAGKFKNSGNYSHDAVWELGTNYQHR
ncbi:hypothetical protein J6590_106044, partial [Homalodisca vitripennis]